LQPNQYHEESKPLSEEEKSLLLISDHGEGDIVRNMYPKLVARIEAIQQQGGIQIFDLTQIYNDNYETLYSDNCCHLNQRGYQLMASAIADRIASTKKETSEQ
jgi:lysophospholipase L1-like esterase